MIDLFNFGQDVEVGVLPISIHKSNGEVCTPVANMTGTNIPPPPQK